MALIAAHLNAGIILPPPPHPLLRILPVPNKPCGFCGPCLRTYFYPTSNSRLRRCSAGRYTGNTVRLGLTFMVAKISCDMCSVMHLPAVCFTSDWLRAKSSPLDEEEIKIKMGGSVDTSLASEGSGLFVDLWD